jgi:hypothetical protein
MTAIFNNDTITVTSSGDVLKSEDGENYLFLCGSGEYTDNNLCIPSSEESPNYYFYSGDGVILTVQCKTQ